MDAPPVDNQLTLQLKARISQLQSRKAELKDKIKTERERAQDDIRKDKEETAKLEKQVFMTRVGGVLYEAGQELALRKVVEQRFETLASNLEQLACYFRQYGKDVAESKSPTLDFVLSLADPGEPDVDGVNRQIGYEEYARARLREAQSGVDDDEEAYKLEAWQYFKQTIMRPLEDVRAVVDVEHKVSIKTEATAGVED